MNNTLGKHLVPILLAGALALSSTVASAAGPAVAKDARCAVCGMFVAKYPNWLATLTMSDGAVMYFDGVKDLMAFHFAPQKYGAKPGATITRVQVTDYYTLAPVEAKAAFYVVGSDVAGPMGQEFVPFATKAAADSFSKDHQGNSILTFEQITAEQVESMRSGQRMR